MSQSVSEISNQQWACVKTFSKKKKKKNKKKKKKKKKKKLVLHINRNKKTLFSGLVLEGDRFGNSLINGK